MREELRQYDKVVATLRPVRMDDLRAGVAECVGRRGVWEALWVVERGPYAGQWAMAPRDEHLHNGVAFAWAPLCDLADLAPAPEAP